MQLRCLSGKAKHGGDRSGCPTAVAMEVHAVIIYQSQIKKITIIDKINEIKK